MTEIFSSPPVGRATSPSEVWSDDEWSFPSHSDGGADFSLSTESEGENPKVMKTPTSPVNLFDSSKSEMGKPKLSESTTSFCMPEMDFNAEDQATSDFVIKKESQESATGESAKIEKATGHKIPAMAEPESELAKMVEKCDSVAEGAASEVDAIAKALSRKLDNCTQFRNSKKSSSTPEQSLAKCERFRDEARRLYKRFDREAHAVYEKFSNEEYSKYTSIQSECVAVEANYRQLCRKAATADRLDATVANYAKWKEAEADYDNKRTECKEIETKAWDNYKQTTGDAWKRYRLEKEEARDAQERVSAEYKRAKSLMSDLTEWSDLPEWKRVALFIGLPLATIFAVIAVANVWGFLTSPVADPKICSKAIEEMVKAATNQQLEVQTEQRWSLVSEMFERLFELTSL